MNERMVVIVGPTASGKSNLAMEAARRWDGEIICADSRTVYREMDIGTAKPSQKDRQAVQHHLLDIASPGDRFSAAEFKEMAEKAIQDIASRGKLPVMAGGSGLYVDSVIFNYRFGPAADQRKRRILEKMSTEELQRLGEAKRIKLPENTRNKRYLIRAIELGGTIKQRLKLRPNTLVVGITTKKEDLLQRIESRANQMIRQGILDELRTLGHQYDWHTEAMTGNIYRAFRGVVEDRKTLNQAKQEFIAADLRLAKRQLTWFKRNPYIKWGTPDELMQEIERFLK